MRTSTKLLAAHPTVYAACCMQSASRYANLVSGVEEVDSCLKDCFAEHINSEVCKPDFAAYVGKPTNRTSAPASIHMHCSSP